MAFPVSPVDNQTATVNGVTYIYSLANLSWSPYSASNTPILSGLSVVGNASVSGTDTVGTSVVTGTETVQGNEYILGNLGIGTASPSYRLTVVKTGGASSTADAHISDGTQWFQINSNSTAGAWNPLNQAGDHHIVYSNGTKESGGLVIGQWSDTNKGLRIDSSGVVTITSLTATNTITGSVSGSAATLTTSRNINGVLFNGSADITVTAAAGTLSGATLASGVTASSLTSVGTLGSLTVTNTITGSVSGNAGTVTNGFYTTSSFNLGTTSIAVNRASASQSLTGISIDGSAGSVAAANITGATLASGVTASSLTSVGTLGSLTVTNRVTAGSAAIPGMSVQQIYLRTDTKSTYSIAAYGTGGTILTDLNTTITPRAASSKIRITFNVSVEPPQNSIWLLYRNIGGAGDTLIGRNVNDANVWSGTWAHSPQSYAGALMTLTFMYLDSPNTTSSIVYKLMNQSSGDAAYTLGLNRTNGSVGTQYYEVAISQVFLEEIAQ
jgi:hypothetical protein